MFVVLCVCQLVRCSTTAGLAEAPERVKQQRDQTITKTLIKKKNERGKKKPKTKPGTRFGVGNTEEIKRVSGNLSVN